MTWRIIILAWKSPAGRLVNISTSRGLAFVSGADISDSTSSETTTERRCCVELATTTMMMMTTTTTYKARHPGGLLLRLARLLHQDAGVACAGGSGVDDIRTVSRLLQ